MNAMSNDETQNELLDAEFRQILLIIKPHINDVDNPYHLAKYRVWLERLNAAGPAEKLERNKYLLELANQIHDKAVLPPFTYNPPKGPLPRFRIPRKDDLEDVQWPYVSPRRSDNRDTQESIPKRVRSKDETPPKKKPVKSKIVRPFQKLGKIEQVEGKSETSSWCDLSETTSATHACGDTDGEEEKKVLSTQHKQEGLKAQEHFMKKYEEDNRKNETTGQGLKTNNFDLQGFLTAEDNNSGEPTLQEVEALKMRMKDLLEVKNALRDTHCLTEDRKKTIDCLQVKLSQVEQQNVELQSLLDTQKRKFMELDKIKSKELNDFKDKFTHLRQKEIEFLKQYHKDEVNCLEKAHSSKISELQFKVDSLKRDYEDKIRRITDSNLSLLKQKEDVIQELQSQLKIKTSQQSNDSSGEQIIGLKRCISKLDKLLHKNEKDYIKKVERLKQEIEVRDMTSQVQIQTQKTDLMVKHSAAKQEELRNALNSLEGKYKKMMETLQLHALESKRHDDKLIEELKTLLEKHNISYL